MNAAEPSQASYDVAAFRPLRLARLVMLLAGLLGLPGISSASGPLFGTKADASTMTAAPAPGLGIGQFLQMMIALGIVFVLIKFAMPKVFASLNKKMLSKSTGSILVEESTSFAGGQLHLVCVRNKTLLLSTSASGVNCLADLTEAGPKADKPLFMEILNHETSNPTHLYVEPTGEPSAAMRSAMTDEEIQAALERLNRLEGI